MPMNETALASHWRKRADEALEQWLPGEELNPSRLHAAMRYAVLDGGKRVRPLLVYAAGQACGVPETHLDAPAVAVELIHAYSLVHDDLPAMDDDDLRRGKPTVHRAFDEATAILTGDALQSLAFHVLARGLDAAIPPGQRLAMLDELAMASGSRGMAGGQAMDLAATGRTPNIAELEDLHIHKTGALIRASVRLGALCRPEVDEQTLQRLDHFAKCIGLAFQIRDDILDVEGDAESLGKQPGVDQALGKATYPSLLGLEEARAEADHLYRDALASLEPLGDAANMLRWLGRYIVERTG